MTDSYAASASASTTAPAPAPASSSTSTASKRQSTSGNATNTTTTTSSSTGNSSRLSMNVHHSPSAGGSAASQSRPSGSSVNHTSSQTQGPGEFDALSKAIGARVKLTTSGPSSPLTIEGTLFTACPVTNLVAINTTPATLAPSDQPPAKAQPSTFRVIPVSRIQTFTLISLPPAAGGFESAYPSITRLDIKALKAREDDAIQKIRARDASRGKGVTKDAQDIFDALARTLPTRWHETSIIVNDSVMIRAPYRVEDCQADKQNQNALIRVKKVLESEKKKIADRNAATSSAAAAASSSATASPVPRKGG